MEQQIITKEMFDQALNKEVFIASLEQFGTYSETGEEVIPATHQISKEVLEYMFYYNDNCAEIILEAANRGSLKLTPNIYRTLIDCADNPMCDCEHYPCRCNYLWDYFVTNCPLLNDFLTVLAGMFQNIDDDLNPHLTRYLQQTEFNFDGTNWEVLLTHNDENIREYAKERLEHGTTNTTTKRSRIIRINTTK